MPAKVSCWLTKISSKPCVLALPCILACLQRKSVLFTCSLQVNEGSLPKYILSLGAEKPSVVDLTIKFPTDENVKRKWVLAMKRLDVNAAGIWEPKKGDVLCSRHFKKTDFDRSAPNIKLKPGVVPSIFDFPSHLQGKKEQLHCRKNFTLKPLPVTRHNHQLVGASSCIEEFQSQFIFEHSYSVMDSPKKLKYKLDHVISELEDTKKSLQNVLDREKRFQNSLGKTIRELKDDCLISQETANRLEAFCWEYYQESIE